MTEKTTPPAELGAASCSAVRRHRKALRELYRSKGVGRTVKQRLAYWESTVPDGYSISHNPTDAQRVAVFETSWLCDQFPQDFHFC